jgi:hypothetical protein
VLQQARIGGGIAGQAADHQRVQGGLFHPANLRIPTPFAGFSLDLALWLHAPAKKYRGPDRNPFGGGGEVLQ